MTTTTTEEVRQALTPRDDCAAYVKAGSPHPHICDRHYKEDRND